MVDRQKLPSWMVQEHDAEQERDAEYWERAGCHLPHEWRCSFCGAILTDDYCHCREESE